MNGSRTLVGRLVVAMLLAAVVVVGLLPTLLRSGTRQPATVESGPVGQPGSVGPGTVLRPGAEGLRELLSRRAQAVRTRNARMFMSSVDPKAPRWFRSHQRELFVNLAEVPLAKWFYQLEHAPPGSASPPEPPVVPADEFKTPRVVLNYALAGVDAVPTSRPTGFVFARRGDSWYLTTTSADPPRKHPVGSGPWHFGACRVIETDSGLVIGHDGNRHFSRRVADLLDSSVDAVTKVWGTDWSQQVGVVIPGSREELRALVGPSFAVDGIAAVAVADSVDVAADRVEGPRIVFNTRTAADLGDTALRVVLQHEITHIAARADTVDGAPMWMLEGFADYVGYRGSGLSPQQIAPDLAHRVHVDGPPRQLPANADFRSSGSRLDLAYQQSWSLVAFLAQQIGRQRLVELYHRVAATRSQAVVNSALEELVGMDRRELLGRWREHLRETFE